MLVSTIHKVTPISTGPNLIAGSSSGTSGFSNATGSAARFYAPGGIVLDGSANMYVADTSNHSIRKVTPLGVVTTFAGTGSSGSTDGTGTSASFSYPKAVAIDSSSNVYVADSGNNSIRKITSAGVVTTLSFLVPSARALSVSSNGGTILAIDGGYGIHMYSNALGFGTPFTGGTFPNATSVALKPDGTFYYFPAPNIFQPTIPTNVTTAYRITFGGYTQLSPHPGTPSGNPAVINGQQVVIVQFSSNPGLSVGDIFTFDINAYTGPQAAYNGYTGQVWARDLSAANNFAFVYATDGSKGFYSIGTPVSSAYLLSSGTYYSNIQAVQSSGTGNYSFIYAAGDPVPSSGSSCTLGGFTGSMTDWNGQFIVIGISVSNSYGGRASAFVSHSSASPPSSSGSGLGTGNGTVYATHATISSNYLNLDGVYYGAGGAFGFWYNNSQLFVGQGGCNINGYSFSGDNGTTNYITSTNVVSNFIAKSETGDELFATNTGSNQVISYSNVY